MKTIKTRPLCNALDISVTRVEQLIGRGYLSPSQPPELGKSREWTQMDAFRLLLMCDLMEIGLEAREIVPQLKLHLQDLFYYHDDKTFLVISVGALGRIIPSTPRGSAGAADEDCTPVHMPGVLYSNIVRGRELLEIVGHRERHASVVINLNERFNFLEEVWKKEASTMEGVFAR